uniref:Uncharacterized protein n=1 Tax=Mantoniella antarctica TaxID=81844 RepID=A0A7S0SR53_9CHLO|eukprot:CAMPEP_0181389682 /NCGR_PEP_ID=MMETSP1106-20121128/25044_1 /TAXON_ID=81844 /ORGANISM="Mantoniella antarctica, Strain SL-175" /LENGTH=140 /DNA_ID=CAMNT_0023510467 /DNA_START=72 /DNA_END=494 /DNA_ORIENTATION=+
MSLAGFGGNDDAPHKGKAIFRPADQNNMKATLYGGDAPTTNLGARSTGRKAAPGSSHAAESPFAVGATMGGGEAAAPAFMHKKNTKWDPGAAKVGAAGVDTDLNRHNYEQTAAVAAQMKHRNQHGGGNFLSFDQDQEAPN